MTSDTKISAQLSIGPKVNAQHYFFLFFYQYPWMISVNIPVISDMEMWFRLALNYLILLQKC